MSSSSDHSFGFATRALHAGHQPDAETGARAVPIYQTTSYLFEDTAHAAALFNLQRIGNIYTRIMNPTTAVFEERMASLERGVGALGLASGAAARLIALTSLLEAGDEWITAAEPPISLHRLGIETAIADPNTPETFCRAITPRTRAIYAETIGSAGINVLDIAAVAGVAHENNLPLIVDNTLASPYLCRPIEHGADIVVHSATEFIGGHGVSIGGVVVDSGRFPWDRGRFPQMLEPSKGYHGIRFYETFGDFAYIMKARVEGLRDLGPAISPFNSFLLLQGLETLKLRMERHSANALAAAQFLESQQRVSSVNYPGLPSSRHHARAQRYLPQGAGAVLSFSVHGGPEPSRRFLQALQLFSRSAQVDGPASQAAAISGDLIRLSVGLEDIDDILWDLNQALTASR